LTSSWPDAGQVLRWKDLSKGLRHPIIPWLVAVAALVTLTHVYPLWRLLQRALGGEGENIRWLLETPRVHLALRHSLWVSAASAALALGAALLLAVLTTQTDLPGRGILRLLFLSPLVIPPQVLALAWIQWAGPVGYLQQGLRWILGKQGSLWSLYTPAGIILLLALFVLPIAYLTLVAGLSRLSKQAQEAAQLDGANLLQVWLYVTLPLLRPSVAAAAALAFLGAWGNFGIPALLGIPGRYLTLPTLLYQEVINFSGDGFGRSAALALLFGLPALFFLSWPQRSQEGLDPGEAPPDPYRLGWLGWLLSGILFAAALLVVLGPLLAMAATALLRAYGLPLTWSNLTLEHFRMVLFDLERARRATLHSLGLAGGAALLCSGIGTILGYALTRLKVPLLALLSFIVDLPYALPGLIFALSLILVWLPPPLPGLSLYGTLWLILMAYLGRFSALALQPLQAAWRSLDTSLEEAASIDGASLLQTFRHILVPLLAPALTAAVLLVFLQSFAELTLSALLVTSRSETFGWLIFGLQQGGYTQQAAALSTLLLIALFALAAGIQALRRHAKPS